MLRRASAPDLGLVFHLSGHVSIMTQEHGTWLQPCLPSAACTMAAQARGNELPLSASSAFRAIEETA
jgi:hypothetical protein